MVVSQTSTEVNPIPANPQVRSDTVELNEAICASNRITVDVFDGVVLDDTDGTKRLCVLEGGVYVFNAPRLDAFDEIEALLRFSLEKYATPPLSCGLGPPLSRCARDKKSIFMSGFKRASTMPMSIRRYISMTAPFSAFDGSR